MEHGTFVSKIALYTYDVAFSTVARHNYFFSVTPFMIKFSPIFAAFFLDLVSRSCHKIKKM
jgi:hypothetical protein